MILCPCYIVVLPEPSNSDLVPVPSGSGFPQHIRPADDVQDTNGSVLRSRVVLTRSDGVHNPAEREKKHICRISTTRK